MRVARLDTLPRQDSLFIGGEPEGRFKRRQLIVVDDDYDFVANNATDVTDVSTLNFMYSISRINYTQYRNCLISYAEGVDFFSLSDNDKKELAKNFAVSKSDRDTVMSAEDQADEAIEVQRLINDESQQTSFDLSSIVYETGVPTISDSNLGSYVAEASSEDESQTSSSSDYQTKVSLITSSNPAGRYRVGWYFETNLSSTSRDFESRVILNSVEEIAKSNVEFEGKENWLTQSGFKYINLSEGANSIDIQFKPSSSATAKIRRSRLEIWKIS